jgi:hypothetical protein
LKVYENRILRKIFGPTGQDVAVDWMRLHNEDLHNLYASPNINRVNKSRRMKWPGHVARMRDENAYKILFGKPEESTWKN